MSALPKLQSETNGKPTVIGLYGIDGSGKTYLLNRLKTALGCEDFLFFEGSEVISEVNAAHGGLDAFESASEPEQEHIREQAIQSIQDRCRTAKKVGIVSGHYSFPVISASSSTNALPHIEDIWPIWTSRDAKVFTHVIYLNTDQWVIKHRLLRDTRTRKTTALSLDQLRTWQEVDASELRKKCYQAQILFTTISEPEITITSAVKDLVERLITYDQEQNLRVVLAELDAVLKDRPQAVLVFDADKTISPQDSGGLYCQNVYGDTLDPLEAIFSSYGYKHDAFRQAALLFNERTPQEFRSTCEEIAKQINLYPVFKRPLRDNKSSHNKTSNIVVVTCGLRDAWEHTFDRHGFAPLLLIGNGRLDDTVIDPSVKAAIVKHLRDNGAHVTAFGDSPIDIPMLKAADIPIVVVGEQASRSKSMDEKLRQAIVDDKFRAHQVLMGDVQPRLDTLTLPIIDISQPGFFDVLRAARLPPLTVITPASSIANLLATPMRDASVSGHGLRQAHQAAGRFLAITYLPDLLGTENFAIPHVQGNTTDGYCIENESSTLIVPLMRGGEPMAFGVSEALPQASFLHAKKAEDLTKLLVSKADNIILVDSVINTGKSVVEFLDHLLHASNALQLKTKVNIVMMAGVVQADAVKTLSSYCEKRSFNAKLSLIALRTSENMFTGKGGTDTGNRLFNTTQVD